MSGISEICSDDRFELIAKAKAKLLDATNIESNQTDMAALDSILFRCWQMGWLDQLRDAAYRMLTAEQVREAIFNGSTYASYDGAKYYADGINMQAIVDELNTHCHCGLTDEDYNGGERMSGNVGKRTDAAIYDWMAVKDGRESRYTRLFGTPERAANTILALQICPMSNDECEVFCPAHDVCFEFYKNGRTVNEMAEWLMGDTE